MSSIGRELLRGELYREFLKKIGEAAKEFLAKSKAAGLGDWSLAPTVRNSYGDSGKVDLLFSLEPNGETAIQGLKEEITETVRSSLLRAGYIGASVDEGRVRNEVGRVLASLLSSQTPQGAISKLSNPEFLRQHAIRLLNELVEADQPATQKLVEFRVEVSDKLMELDTPVVVVTDPGKPNLLGVLGLINGILGAECRIEGIYDDNGTEEGLLLKFGPHPQPTLVDQPDGSATS